MCFESAAVAIENRLMSSVHNEDLFRKQAIQSLSQKSPGRPICLVPRPWAWLTLLIVLLFLSAGVFAGNAEYSRKETVPGWLVSRTGVARVTTRSSAVVREVARRPGDRVTEGEALVYLSADSSLANGNSRSQEILVQLRLEKMEVDKQIELSKEQQQLEKESLRKQFESLDAEGAALASRLNDQSHRLELGAEKLRRLEGALIDGAVTEWDVIQQKDESGEITQGLRRLQQEIANQQRERELISGREKSSAMQAEVQRSTLRARHMQLSQRIAEQEVQRLSVLKSPVTGTVASVEVHAGNTVAPQQLLITVVPTDVDLAAEVFVPSRAAGFIRRGQSVRIAYDAFPQEKFGTFEGRISYISEYVLLPGEIPQTFPIREATYKIQIALTNSSIETSVGIAGLRPGMLLAADIVLDKRSFIDWLLEPLRLRRSAAH